MDMRIRNVLPQLPDLSDLEETVRLIREAALSRVDLQSTQLTRTLEEGFARVIDNLNALRTSIPEQLLTVPRSVVNQATTTAVLPSSTSSAAATAGSSFVPLNYWQPARRAIRSKCNGPGGCVEGVARGIGHRCCQAGFEYSGPRCLAGVSGATSNESGSAT